MTTVVTTENKLECLVDRVEDIEEEFANKLEQHEKAMKDSSEISQETITRLESKIDLLETTINRLLYVEKEKVSPVLANYNTIQSKSNTEHKEDNEGKIGNQIKCDICQKAFKSIDNLQTHDIKFHIKRTTNKGKVYKCDQCNFTSAGKIELHSHIKEQHKKCDICGRMFTNTKVLETHVKATHKKELIKHTIEREPSLKNHKIKKIA